MPVDFIGMLKALFLFLYKFSESLLLIIPDILKLVRSWADYWYTKNQRYKDAVATEIETKLKAAQNQAQKEQANLLAAMYIYNSVWLDTFNQFKAHLDSNEPEHALLMLREDQFSAANDIIFNANSANSIKAQLLTDLVRKG